MKTTYAAWAVQVLRDGEWEWQMRSDGGHGEAVALYSVRWLARYALRYLAPDVKRRVRKVRVTVEEV
jgi:hypothetical protein